MASCKFDPKAGKARVFFRLAGRQYNRTVRCGSAREAERAAAVAEETVAEIERGRLALPAGADVVAFVLSGGKAILLEKAEPAPPEIRTVAELLERYELHPPPHLEASTRKMQGIHGRHLVRAMGGLELERADSAAAQAYVARRSASKFRGRAIGRVTIEKELKTLRQAWEWVAAQSKGVPAPGWALRDVRFPKARGKSPFLSWGEAELEAGRPGLSPDEVAEVWDCLWLDRGQVRELLEHVRGAARWPFLHPMFCFAAYTGARRSELCRSRVSDWRIAEGSLKVRQKKRDRESEFTFRDIPIHPELAATMRGWFAAHPGGPHALCGPDGAELTWDRASHHFKAALEGSRWSVVRGWHVLRHSFASNLASAGIDQRKIDAWMGHTTDIRLRYQHLRPKDAHDSIGVL